MSGGAAGEAAFLAELVRSESVDPDWELLARVGGGDGGAFEELVERHHRRLLRVCERLLGDQEEARDAVQEVLIKVLHKAGGFRPQALVSTWLYRIAVNHCLNVLRRRRLVRMLSLTGPREGGEEGRGEGAAIDPAEERPGPQRELAARREWRRVQRAIAALPPGQRAVLVLVRLEGLAYKEVAETLGITLGAVESRLVRAMRTLERLQDQAQGRAE
jgi:RNA polymerase sigma-70 factor (ECF subfamily)